MQDLRAKLGAAIRRGSGVNVIMPQLTTAQVARSQDLLRRFLEEPSYRPADGLAGEAWFVEYKARDGYLPESASVAWTRDLAGNASAYLSGMICYMDDVALTDSLVYTYTHDLSNVTGTTFEARVKVTSGDVAANSGLLLSIEDGTSRFDVYCRSGDLNIDDDTDTAYSVDLTRFRWVRLSAKGSSLLVSVDGSRLCVGGAKAASTGELVAWGSTSSSLVNAQVRDVRAIAKTW